MQEVEDGQFKQVKADVAAENGINLAVRDTIDVAQKRFPLGRAAAGEHEGQKQTAQHEQPFQPADLFQQIEGIRCCLGDGAFACHQPIAKYKDGGYDKKDGERGQFNHPLFQPYILVILLAKPEPIGVRARNPVQAANQHEGDDGEPKEAALPKGVDGWLRGTGRTAVIIRIVAVAIIIVVFSFIAPATIFHCAAE